MVQEHVFWECTVEVLSIGCFSYRAHYRAIGSMQSRLMLMTRIGINAEPFSCARGHFDSFTIDQLYVPHFDFSVRTQKTIFRSRCRFLGESFGCHLGFCVPIFPKACRISVFVPNQDKTAVQHRFLLCKCTSMCFFSSFFVWNIDFFSACQLVSVGLLFFLNS